MKKVRRSKPGVLSVSAQAAGIQAFLSDALRLSNLLILWEAQDRAEISNNYEIIRSLPCTVKLTETLKNKWDN